MYSSRNTPNTTPSRIRCRMAGGRLCFGRPPGLMASDMKRKLTFWPNFHGETSFRLSTVRRSCRSCPSIDRIGSGCLSSTRVLWVKATSIDDLRVSCWWSYIHSSILPHDLIFPIVLSVPQSFLSLDDLFNSRILGGSKEDFESPAPYAPAARSQVDQESSAVLWENMETM